MKQKTNSKRTGFALIVALSLMTFVFLLLMGLATLIQVETATSTTVNQLSQARANAIFGMQAALGQLQKHAGPDQAATAPATIYYSNTSAGDPTWDDYKQGMRDWVSDAAGSGGRSMPYGATRMTADEREDFVDDSTIYWDGRQPHWVGVWEGVTRDTDGDYDRNQQPVWLVSGYDPNAATPLSPTAAETADYITLVGTGSAVDVTEAGYVRQPGELNGIVKAPKVRLTTSGSEAIGAYAYYVSDESQKLNITLTDPYANAAVSDGEYSRRLYSPQRGGLEALSDIADAFADEGWDINDPRFENLVNKSNLVFLTDDAVTEEMIRKHFHTLTTNSKGLFTDAARGGLRKDLSYYLETGSGLADNDPIADPSLYQGDERIGQSNGGFPNSDNNIPTWGQLRDWATNVSDGSTTTVAVTEDVAPMLMSFRMFYGFSRQNEKVYAHLLPILVMWNPYDVQLENTSYDVELDMWYFLEDLRVATRGLSDNDAPGADDEQKLLNGVEYGGFLYHALTNPSTMPDDNIEMMNAAARVLPSSVSGTNPNGVEVPTYEYSIHPNTSKLSLDFTSSFEAGEILVFTPSIEGDIEIVPDGFGGTLGTYRIPMGNQFFANAPAMVRINVFDFSPLGSIPSDADEVRIYQVPDTNITATIQNGAFDVKFSITASGGKAILEESVFGTNEPWSIKGNFSLGSSEDSPNNWRWLYPTTKFNEQLDHANDKENSNLEESPIVLVSNFALQPFTANITTTRNHGRFRADHVDFFMNYMRFFANYNASSNLLSPHPDVDQKRDIRHSYNPDGFKKLTIFKEISANNGGGVISWDHNIAISPDDGSLRPTRGYSIISNTYHHESPFEALTHMPMRSVLRSDVDLLSLAQFSQANLSHYFWQPAFAIGNSEASPYVSREFISGLHNSIYTKARYHGTNTERVENDSDNKTIDISYLLNDALWDGYFLSSTPRSGLEVDAIIQGEASLPNARYQLRTDVPVIANDLQSLTTPAYYLHNVAAFNVNTTSVEAWRGLLRAFNDLKITGNDGSDNPDYTIPIPRSPEPLADQIAFVTDDPEPQTYGAVSGSDGVAPLKDYTNLLAGYRYLNDDMIDQLAERIADEVKLRGPFYSLSDFVNRRLVAPDYSNNAWEDARTKPDPTVAGHLSGTIADSYDATVGLTGINGTIQRAINLSGINGGDNYPQALQSGSSYQDDWIYRTRDNIPQDIGRASFFAELRNYLDTEHLAGAPAGESGMLFSHSPGFVTQADILSMIGSALTTRGDTFKIRSYGEVENPITGEVEAKAWLETIVQRIPDPVADANNDREPDDAWGRQFRIVSARWLTEDEV